MGIQHVWKTLDALWLIFGVNRGFLKIYGISREPKDSPRFINP